MVGLLDVLDAGQDGAGLLVHLRHATQAAAGHGAAVIGVLARDDDAARGLLDQVPVAAHHLDHGVDGLGS